MLAAHAGRLPGRHGEVHDKPGNGTVETTGSVALASGPAVFLGCAKDVALFLGLDCRLAHAQNRLVRNNGEYDMKKLKPDRATAASPVFAFKMKDLGHCNDAHSGAT